MSAVILDCETTGLVDPEPVEIAWMQIDRPGKVSSRHWHGRFKPAKPITLVALATHGITEEDVADMPPVPTIFTLPRGSDYIIGHNVDFDWQAIGKPDVKRICTAALSRRLWPDADSHSLSAMIWLHFRPIARECLDSAHSAMTDCINTERLLGVILAELRSRGLLNGAWEDVWKFSEAARVPTHMPFGKHKGSLIADIPRDYKKWLLNLSDLDPYMRLALSR